MIADDRAGVRALAGIQAPFHPIRRTWPSLEDILSEKRNKKSRAEMDAIFDVANVLYTNERMSERLIE